MLNFVALQFTLLLTLLHFLENTKKHVIIQNREVPNNEILFSIAHEQYWYLSTTLINLSCLHRNFSPSSPKTDCFSQPHNVLLSLTQVLHSSYGPTEGGSCPSPATTQQACSYSLLTNLVKQVSYRDLAPVERHKQELQQLSFHSRTILLQPHRRHWRACSADREIQAAAPSMFDCSFPAHL